MGREKKENHEQEMEAKQKHKKSGRQRYSKSETKKTSNSLMSEFRKKNKQLYWSRNKAEGITFKSFKVIQMFSMTGIPIF